MKRHGCEGKPGVNPSLVSVFLAFDSAWVPECLEDFGRTKPFDALKSFDVEFVGPSFERLREFWVWAASIFARNGGHARKRSDR